MKNESNLRLGKVQYKSSPRVHYSGLHRGTKYKTYPWINLSGQWVQDAGFQIGEPVVITVLKNKLIISKIKTEKNENAKKQRREQPEKNKDVRCRA
ncbi:type I addiction module toxin, SymE family [Chitinophaga oryziterrae]|uniref:Type I addiction module toxin, SymE family n=1 Tax=Chitinophaga oryziterrae TaxID=1031224 RepID=A0A6N8J795_9BACT|nr:type I addiction module toxin, SymE family [Chitinophaga oryziterrae]